MNSGKDNEKDNEKGDAVVSLVEIPELQLTRDEIERFYLGNYYKLDDLDIRPLAKLTHDFCVEKGIIIE